MCGTVASLDAPCLGDPPVGGQAVLSISIKLLTCGAASIRSGHSESLLFLADAAWGLFLGKRASLDSAEDRINSVAACVSIQLSAVPRS